ncbi:MAG: metal-dependent hydrolase [Ferruginibacter sp.]
MDSLTHIAIGACMGEAFAGKTVGRKAMLWGIAAQSIPDIDFISSFWMDTSSSLLAHRGFTHSILFALVITGIMARFANHWHRPHNISFLRWVLFFAFAIMGHLFLDCFNNYGVGLLEPFDHHRFSFNTIYVADPFFSIAPIVALVMLLIPRKKTRRRFWWKFGLSICSIYLCYALVNKWVVDRGFRNSLARQQINYTRYFTTPAPLQNWLWFVVAGNDNGYYAGYRSVFDGQQQSSPLTWFPRNAALADSLSDRKALDQLVRFSQGFYTIEKREDTLLFNDLRFGQVIGWENPKEAFAFHYYLHPDIDNKLVVQRGRFAKWTPATFKIFLERIKGR